MDCRHGAHPDPNPPGDSPSTLVGDGALKRCAVISPGKGYEGVDLHRFDNSLFKVCPAFSYRERREYNQYQRRHSSAGLEKGQARARSFTADLEVRFGGVVHASSRHTKPQPFVIRTSPPHQQASDENYLDTLKTLRARKEREEDLNGELLGQVECGAMSDTAVKYGTIVQLRHVNSGLFLACHKGSAPQDSDCRRVSLKHGSAASSFWVQPRFKAQQEGSTLYYGYSFKLESANLERMYLHTSPKATYSTINNPENTALPKVT